MKIAPSNNDTITSDLLFTPNNTPLDQNPAAVYIARLPSQHSKRNMSRYLSQIAALLSAGKINGLELQWGTLRYQHTGAIRALLLEQYAPRTVNAMLSALRGVLKEAWRLGQMSADDYQRAIDVENIQLYGLPSGRELSAGEIMALSTACRNDRSWAGIRDLAIIALLYTCGLRRAELAKLSLDDYNGETGQLKVISGKGRKDRTVYVVNGARAALHDWLEIRGNESGTLFMPINKGGKLRMQPITAQTVYNILKKRGKEAGVTDFTAHDLRRTFVGDMLDRGVDIVTVQRLVGHASPETTARYDRRPEEIKRSAAQKLFFPYERRTLTDE